MATWPYGNVAAVPKKASQVLSTLFMCISYNSNKTHL